MLVFEMLFNEFAMSVIDLFRPTQGVQVFKEVRVYVFPDLYRLTYSQIPMWPVHIDRV